MEQGEKYSSPCTSVTHETLDPPIVSDYIGPPSYPEVKAST